MPADCICRALSGDLWMGVDSGPLIDDLSGGYRVEVGGELRVRLDLTLSSDTKDHGVSALVTVATANVNAIPQVCEAPPGVVTYADLNPHRSKMSIAPGGAA